MPLPADLVQPLTSLLVALQTHQAPSTDSVAPGRHYSAIFRDLPDKHVYADYYIVIKEPRSLNGVLDSIRKGIYSSPVAVAYDLFLVWSNARKYNAEGSQVFEDANVLESLMRKLWKERSPPLPPWKALLKPDGYLAKPKKPEKTDKHALNASTSASAAPAQVPPASTTSTINQAPAAAFPKIKLKTTFGASSSTPSASTASPAPTPQASGPLKMRVAPPAAAPQPQARPALATAPSQSASPAPAASGGGGFTLKLSVKPPTAATASKPPPVPKTKPQPPPATTTMSTTSSGSPGKINILQPGRPSPALPPLPPLPATSFGAVDGPARKRARDGSPSVGSERKKDKRAKAAQAAAASAAAAAAATTISAPGALPASLPPIPNDFGSPAPAFSAQDIDTGWLTDAGPDPVRKYLDILRKLRSYKDASGGVYARHVLAFPDRTRKPDLYASIPEPLSLQTIEDKAVRKVYATPEDFDKDLHQLFEQARRFRNPEDDAEYADIVLLQRLYHELTRPPSIQPHPLAPGTLSSVLHGPANPNRPADVSDPKALSADKIPLTHILFKGEVFKTGDWVHLLNPDRPSKPIVGQIFRVFVKADTLQKYMNVCWYYHPEETIHPATRQFYEHEVFKTNTFVEHAVEDFIERCVVMYFTKYVRGRPKPPYWQPGIPLYVCEHRYKEDMRSFKRIKNWLTCIPEEVRKKEYAFEPFAGDKVEVLPQVSSPFVRGVQGPGGIGDALEPVEDDQARFHKLASGQQATPSALRAAEQAKRLKAQHEEALAAAAAVAASAVPSTFSMRSSAQAQQQTARDAIEMAILTNSFKGLNHEQVDSVTPAEMAAQRHQFAPLPQSIKSKFRSDAFGDLLWFTSPALQVADGPSDTNGRTKPTHSLEYLYWKAMRGRSAAST